MVISEKEPGSSMVFVGVQKTMGVHWNKRARPDIRRNFLPVRIGKQWYRLPRGAVQSYSLEVFKTQLDQGLSKLIWPCC